LKSPSFFGRKEHWRGRGRRCSRQRHWYLSERDIIRAVARRGTAVFNDALSMHMTAEVITTSEFMWSWKK
jgi:hypothetical protein